MPAPSRCSSSHRPRSPAEAIPALLREDLAQNVAEHGTPPIITVVPGLGIFAAGDTYKEADLARHIYLDAMRVVGGRRRHRPRAAP